MRKADSKEDDVSDTDEATQVEVAPNQTIAPKSSGGSGARRKWDFTERSSAALVVHENTAPFGYLAGNWDHSQGGENRNQIADAKARDELVYQSAMKVAYKPGSQLMGTCFMLWMVGNTLQLFSIMSLGMAFMQPFQRVLSLNKEFKKYEGSSVDISIPKALFVALNLVGIAIALYKCHTMRLLPTAAIDWVEVIFKTPVENSAGAVWS